MAGKRRSKKRHHSDAEVNPQLTSLIDILMVVLVFLLKTFAISPINVADPSVQLPLSNSQEPITDLVVVMITGSARQDRGPRGEVIERPEIPTIVVDDDVILHLGQNFEIPESELEGQFVIRKLTQRLIEERKVDSKTAELMDQQENYKGKIIFVVDRNVPYSTLSSAMLSSAKAGYPDFSFAIVKSEG